VADLIARPLSSSDLARVTDVHLAAFPQSALTSLGSEAVRRYYEWLFLGPHSAVALGAWVKSDLVGFCFGGIFRGAMSGFIRKNRAFLAYRVLSHPWLIASPRFHEVLPSTLLASLPLLALGARRSAPTKAKERFFAFLPTERRAPSAERCLSPAAGSFGILAIAVDPRSQRLGAGRLLMAQSEEAARQRGFGQMHLTVRPENAQAIRFYESLGWEPVPQEPAWSGFMRKVLEPAAPETARTRRLRECA
jgi:ribosomal protein S18 acetylase RimI-like enzyme